MWASRSERFPEETPSTREYYLLRSIFEEHFPSKSALETVPKVIATTDLAVFCDTADSLLCDFAVIHACPSRRAHNTNTMVTILGSNVL